MARLLILFLLIGVVAEIHATDSASSLHKRGQVAFQQHDLQAAIRYFEQASRLNHSASQVQLGWILDSIGEHKDAFELFSKAAEAGNSEGQYLLAEKLISGEGTDRNEAEAVNWMTKAASAGHSAAIRRLAIAFESGELGLSPNPVEAVKWLQQGVILKDNWTIQRLSRAYRNGELGLTVDLPKSAEFDALLGSEE